MRKQIKIAVGAVIILAFAAFGVHNILSANNKIKLRDIELKSTSSELQKLETEYDVLNKNLQKANEEKESSAEDLQKLKNEKDELEKKRQELEAQLQAKVNARKEQERLASASNVLNVVTNTKTASASAVDIKSIIVQAAQKYGVDPNRALRIANCESTFNPSSVNNNYVDPTTGTRPMGLFQHVEGYWAKRASDNGYPGASIFDPVANANVTMSMWSKGSANLWECK